MLIGIDMLAVQASEGGARPLGRFGRQLVEAVLARDGADRFVLYAHEGLPLDQVPPSSRRATRKVLPTVASAGSAGRRPALQRALDGNPDGLDWMLLLDPFAAEYGGVPPESPLGVLKVASLVFDLAAARRDERCLAPLRRHEAIFAVSAVAAAQCRGWLGAASSRVAALPVAPNLGFGTVDPAEPLSRTTGGELGGYGITGAYLLHVVDRPEVSADVASVVEIYSRLPVELRHAHRLVIVGPLDDPAAVGLACAARGCGDRLTLISTATEMQLRSLYRRCSAFIAPLVEPGTGLPLLEAMRSGAPVLAGRDGPLAAIVGDAGLLVDPSDPAEVAEELAELLRNPDLDQALRKQAACRAGLHGWDPVVDAVLAVLSGGQTPAATSAGAASGATGTRFRIDAGHQARPRIAIFPTPAASPGRVDQAGRLLAPWAGHYNVDFYFDAAEAGLADHLPVEYGGFDARLFDRNDGLLDYHAVVHRVGRADQLDATIARLAGRPGLVLLEDDDFLDAALPDAEDAPGDVSPARGPDRWTVVPPAEARERDAGQDAALAQVRALIRTGSLLAVRSPRHYDLLHRALMGQAESIHLVPLDEHPAPQTTTLRAAARARLDLWDETVVVGQFRPDGPAGSGLLDPRALKAILKTVPGLVLLTFGGDRADGDARLARDARRLGVADRFLLAPAVEPAKVAEAAALLDLAVHPGGLAGGVAAAQLCRQGVPTLAVDRGAGPAGRSLARNVRDLARDPAARAELAQAGRDYVVGVADPRAAAGALADLIDRCAFELPRASGRRLRRARPATAAGLVHTPHFSRPASASDAAAPGRGAR